MKTVATVGRPTDSATHSQTGQKIVVGEPQTVASVVGGFNHQTRRQSGPRKSVRRQPHTRYDKCLTPDQTVWSEEGAEKHAGPERGTVVRLLRGGEQRRGTHCMQRADDESCGGVDVGNDVVQRALVRPRYDKRKTDARPQLYALVAQTKRETSLTLRPGFHQLL
ncbi:hypothetical protein J6590_085187 [Homalodisca vitripennis]|nr:hypothetical protein J6590_085187 [Homalodisca vitripennis]